MESETNEAMDAYLPGAASLVDQLDSKIFTILRDGRNLVGTLRSFDQYLNLVLEETFERITCDGRCCFHTQQVNSK
jgi:small nuclear ribonucleoprotein (snRNP)-like protein